MARFYKVLLAIEDAEDIVAEVDIEDAIEETLEYLPYDLSGRIVHVYEVNNEDS